MEQNPGGRVRSQPPTEGLLQTAQSSLEEDSPAGPGLPWVGEFSLPKGHATERTQSTRETESDMRQDGLQGARLLVAEF